MVQARPAGSGRPPLDALRTRASVADGARSRVALGLDLPERAPGIERQRLRLLALYREVLGTAATPYPGIVELLAELEQRGIRWGIATNKPRYLTELLLERLDITPAPGSVVCPDDGGEGKPPPASLLLTCRGLQCNPGQAIYVGDHRRDIEAGNRAHMHTIAAVYGYIEPGDDPYTWGADRHVENSRELRDTILG